MRAPSGGYRRGRGRAGGGLLGGRGGIIIIGLIGLAVYYFSNQEYDAFTGKTQFNTISIEQATKLGRQSYVQILHQEGDNVLCSGAGSYCDATSREMVDTVNEIGDRLRVAAIEWTDELVAAGQSVAPVARDFDWTFNVIRSEQPNAFCLPGGYVAVYTQILDVTGNEDGRVTLADISDPNKLAVVMGHEIGHALSHHGAKRMSNSQLAQLGGMAVALGLGDMSSNQQMMVRQAFGMAAQGGLLAFSREHESDADWVGLNLLVRACYDPREAPELWERMGRLGGSDNTPEWMRTHPTSEARAANFRKWMPDAIAMYEERCGQALD